MDSITHLIDKCNETIAGSDKRAAYKARIYKDLAQLINRHLHEHTNYLVDQGHATLPELVADFATVLGTGIAQLAAHTATKNPRSTLIVTVAICKAATEVAIDLSSRYEKEKHK